MAIINSIPYDATNVEVRLNTSVFLDLKEATYKFALEPGESKPLGRASLLNRTVGTYTSEGSVTIAKSSFDDLVTELGGDNYMTVEFPIFIEYAKTGEAARRDVLEKCRIKAVDVSISGGSADPLYVKLDLSIAKVQTNGIYALAELR